MTDRKLLKMALEALEANPANPALWPAKTKAIKALRAALAEPVQEPVAWMHPDGRVIPARTMIAAKRDGGAMLSSVAGYVIPLGAITPPALRAALAEPVREPVAPARRPLTDEEMPPMPSTGWVLHMPANQYENEWTSTQSGYDEDDMKNYARAAIAKATGGNDE